MTRTYKVIDEAGLHARPATLLVKCASNYSNDTKITFKDRTMTMKSIMAVMSMGIPCGETFDITVPDDDGTIFAEIESILKEHGVI
jgi:phosphocarrier protein